MIGEPVLTNAQDTNTLAPPAEDHPNNAGGGEAFRLRHRLLLNSAVHAALFAVALIVAYLIRYDSGVPGAGGWAWFHQYYLLWLPYVIVVKLLFFGRAKLLRGGWQYSSIRDIASILMASWMFFFVTVIAMYAIINIPGWFDRKVTFLGEFLKTSSGSVLVLDFLATVFLVSTARLGFRIYREELRPTAPEGLRRVLVVGAGNAAESIVREIHRMKVERYLVLGMLDDDPAKDGILIHGVPVLGTTEDIREICEDKKIDEIIIAIPSATQKQLRRVIELCGGTKLKFQSLPGVGDLVEGRVTVSQIRPVDINDLLGREQVELDCEAIAHFLRGRRVLVTGAGGSIGSEMCRQICKFLPACLVLVEQAETPLFDIENELRAAHGQTPLHAAICDITDRARVMRVWKEHRPEVVIHAAAHKHVPMMERNPGEAVKNNILGTKNVADASCEVGCAEFVTISTDKAVNPSSVMGAAKRVAEIYTQSLNGHDGCRTHFKAVRFGNVLGSAGSVVPTFRRQIAAGGPVTVTHSDMTRYFMTIPEAAQLVLQAATIGQGGQIFLLDMGEPVRIVDLARQMITLSGFRPDEDIDIVFTGVRPGEKLFEELRTSGEDVEPTVHPKVLVWKCTPPDWNAVEKAMTEFQQVQNSPDGARIRQALKALVPEYEPPAAADERPRQEAQPAPEAAAPAGPSPR